MPAYISPLDENFVTLERAAQLFCCERPENEAASLVEMFKQAIFRREFNYRVTPIPGIVLGDDRNCPLLLIEAPRREGGLTHDLVREERPQEYLAAVAETIAEILGERKILPGSQEDWAAFTEFLPGQHVIDNALEDLARIPFSTYPAKAQALLAGIVFAKAKLATWVLYKGYAMPEFLRPFQPAVTDPVRGPAAKSDVSTQTAQDDANHPKPSDRNSPRKRGRPPKVMAKKVIRPLAIELYLSHREEWSREAIAATVLEKIGPQFPEKDLPAVSTIVGWMSDWVE